MKLRLQLRKLWRRFKTLLKTISKLSSVSCINFLSEKWKISHQFPPIDCNFSETISESSLTIVFRGWIIASLASDNEVSSVPMTMRDCFLRLHRLLLLHSLSLLPTLRNFLPFLRPFLRFLIVALNLKAAQWLFSWNLLHWISILVDALSDVSGLKGVGNVWRSLIIRIWWGKIVCLLNCSSKPFRQSARPANYSDCSGLVL